MLKSCFTSQGQIKSSIWVECKNSWVCDYLWQGFMPVGFTAFLWYYVCFLIKLEQKRDVCTYKQSVVFGTCHHYNSNKMHHSPKCAEQYLRYDFHDICRMCFSSCINILHPPPTAKAAHRFYFPCKSNCTMVSTIQRESTYCNTGFIVSCLYKRKALQTFDSWTEWRWYNRWEIFGHLYFTAERK